MRSKALQAVYNAAIRLDSQIAKKGLQPLIKDGLSRFNFNVVAIHEEGTIFDYRNAYAVVHTDQKKRDWLIIVPEHHDINVMAMDEVQYYAMTEYVEIPRTKKKKPKG